jgi:hypothetical protein
LETDAFADDGADYGEAVRAVAFRHGLTERRFEELLAAQRRRSQRADETNGGQAANVTMGELSALDRSLQFGGAGAWARRIRSASGREALFDRDFRFLSVSQAGRTMTPCDGPAIELPERAFLGVSYATLLPATVSLLRDSEPGFDGLKERGFFRGKFMGVRIRVELNYGFHFLSGIMEVWAVQTLDQGILAHSLIHPADQASPTIAAPGVNVSEVDYF